MLKSEKNQRGYGELQKSNIEKINGFGFLNRIPAF